MGGIKHLLDNRFILGMRERTPEVLEVRSASRLMWDNTCWCAPTRTTTTSSIDLAERMRSRADVGRSVTDASAESLARAAVELVDEVGADAGYSERCKDLSARLFSADTAVRQIAAALRPAAQAA